ncbi:ABC transporter ATP-binding protein [Rhodopirellula europaea]|uniref:ABC transporter, ATP-binding/permease protein n=1 Tax=Rhodopirellula europaea SH398 TaxID=1263868 RepID=M5SAT4_9BACT|nr:ABC transporter ATP-binding protein [Rhodopirellula europaea]EMI24772.1 ABC transporter, ATP-binding/permease protein [Rhodopirellula europaea SH398]
MIKKFTQSIRQFAKMLTPRQKKFTTLLLVLMAGCGVLEVISIISLSPFLAIAAKPELIMGNAKLAWLYQATGVESQEAFLAILGALVLFVLLLANFANAQITYAQLRLAGSINASISSRLLQHYLHQPYKFFLQRNTSHLQSFVQTESVNLTSYGLVPLLWVVQKSINASLILIAIVVVDPVAAFGSAFAFLFFYLTIYIFVRKKLARLGKLVSKTNRERYRLVSEAFGMIKLTRIHELEDDCIKRFKPVAALNARCLATQNAVGMVPRFALEGIVLTIMMGMILYLIMTTNDFRDAIPIIGFYAFAAYRIMPSVQTIYSSISMMQFGWPRVQEVFEEFQSGDDTDSTSARSYETVDSVKPKVASSSDSLVELENVWFNYPATDEPTIRGVSLFIHPKTTIGFCGTTGAGKSTIVDLIVGLLRPQNGCIRIDGKKLQDEALGDWYKRVGYVPQDIYLVDASIAENVALGVPPEQIDMDRVISACQQANVAEFIDTLPEGYQSMAGENGTRLSGGQKQRLGIARALYRDPEVVVFDEATSNLDTETEQAVMSALKNLSHQRTILLIAHRLETLKFCDRVFQLANGDLVKEGTYEEVIESRLDTVS